jgi:hypothetical protein
MIAIDNKTALDMEMDSLTPEAAERLGYEPLTKPYRLSERGLMFRVVEDLLAGGIAFAIVRVQILDRSTYSYKKNCQARSHTTMWEVWRKDMIYTESAHWYRAANQNSNNTQLTN